MPQSCPHNSELGPQHDYHIGDFDWERREGGESEGEDDRERGGQWAEERRRGGMREMEEEKGEERGEW